MSKFFPNQTQNAYLATRFLDTPLWAIYNMLPFILQKSLHASPLQIAIIIAIKPIVSVLSMYWSSLVNDRPDRLRANIIIARILGVIPFFFYPYFNSPWFFIASSGIYMMLAVGVVPAWMEMLKRNLSDSKRKQTFAWGSSIGYLGGGLLPLLFGWFLDSSSELWRWIFPVAGLCSLGATFFQLNMPISEKNKTDNESIATISSQLVSPWKNAIALLSSRKDFACYQIGFMVMGCGLMLMQPTLYSFFDEKLLLSYLEFAVALSFCKGISYAFASPLWARWLNRVGIFKFSSLVTALASLFPLLLLSAMWEVSWLYAAYVLYGIMQAGSEMSWNMSGPIFSKEQDSSPFTSVNVVTVGLRGLFAPALGSFLFTFTGSSTFVMLLGCSMFLIATMLFLTFSKKYEKHERLAALE